MIRSVQQVQPGDGVRATLADGEILMNVREKTSVHGLANMDDSKSR